MIMFSCAADSIVMVVRCPLSSSRLGYQGERGVLSCQVCSVFEPVWEGKNNGLVLVGSSCSAVDRSFSM
jgi:hypothetical protein